MTLVTHMAPPAFIASINALAKDTRALADLTPGMADLVSDGKLPDEMEPLVELGGSTRRHTVSIFPLTQGTKPESKVEFEIGRGFDYEREHLQRLVDRHSHAHIRHGFPDRPEVSDDVRHFLTRLVSVTGLPLHEVLGCNSVDRTSEMIEWFVMGGGLRTFSRLDGRARKILKEYTDAADPSVTASRFFESALCYMALSDEYADEAVEARFFVASNRFAEARLLNAAAISSDLASRWWHPAPFKAPGDTKNHHHGYASRLFAESIRLDPDPFSFSERYLYGLYHAKKASDFTSMSRIFGSSSDYFKSRRNPFEAARAHIREAWAFSQRTDILAKDWLDLSMNLRSAIELFTDSWMERDAKTVSTLRELSATAGMLSGTV